MRLTCKNVLSCDEFSNLRLVECLDVKLNLKLDQSFGTGLNFFFFFFYQNLNQNPQSYEVLEDIYKVGENKLNK